MFRFARSTARWLRRIVIAALALVLLIAAAAGSAFLLIDFDATKELIVAELENATGREVRIDGSIGIRPSLTPRLIVKDIHIANAPWASGPDILSANRLEIGIELLPLLQDSAVEIERIVAY